MAKAKKLPSGNWRVNQYIGKDENGKRMFKSFTAPTKKEAEYMASEYMMNSKESKSISSILLKDAMLNMIELKKPTISPATYRNYMQMYNCYYFDSIKDTPISSLTDKKVQQMINSWVNNGLSAKTIKNLYSLFLSTIKTVNKLLVFDVRLPQQYKPELYIPNNDEVSLLINESKDTLLEMPIILAAFMGLRRSEIVALKWENVDLENRKLTICEATVLNEFNKEVTKKPKSAAGKRTLDIPEPVVDALYRHKNDNSIQVVPLAGTAIYKHFRTLQNNLEMNHFRFHDLRHYYASVMLALGIPDKYAMERIGHSSNSTLKNVYQHIMEKKQGEFSNQLNDFFTNL